ncbi:YDG domain-containing protein, partial [Eubacteriales bacterium OttesenSCG-928-K08]|nr:YDG domain-containing protein [Eubacteriales bacterium OttesenSCG-928-K08]
TGWHHGVAGELTTWNELLPGTKYVIYAFLPAEEGSLASDIVSVPFVTPHRWSLAVSPATLNFDISSSSGTNLTKTVVVTNSGTGTISGLTATLKNNDDNAFSLPVNPKDTLAPGESTTFSVMADGSLAVGEYLASVEIAAQQNSPETGEQGSLTSKTVALKAYIMNKSVVTITGLAPSYNLNYDGSAKPISLSGISAGAYNGALEIVYEGIALDGVYYGPSASAPTKAGSYTVTVRVPYSNADYMGSAEATLTISPKALNITGISAITRDYNAGTRVEIDSTNAKLNGICAGDNVSIKNGWPTHGQYADANKGTNKAVTLDKIVLLGEDASNYTLTQPAVSGEVRQLTVTPEITIQPREYDGTNLIAGNLISVTLPGVLGWDGVSVTYANALMANANAGVNKAVTLGTRTVTGDANNNYNLLAPASPTATITPKKVDVTISGQATQTYNGTSRSVQASYDVCEGDTASVSVFYNGSALAPISEGIYTLTVHIGDSNYELRNILGITTLTIEKAQLLYTNASQTVSRNNTSERSVPLSVFNISAPSGHKTPELSYALGTVTGDTGILNGSVRLENDSVVFRLTSGAALGSSVVIPVVVTPAANTYAQVTVYLTLTVSEEGLTNTVVNAPKSVKLGQDINFTNVYLRTVYDSGKPAEQVAASALKITTNYDKNATGAGSIGTFTVTLTHPSDPARTASFSIVVEDVVTGIALVSSPKLNYEWMKELEFDLSGGKIALATKSGIYSEVSLTAAMLSAKSSELANLGSFFSSITHEGFTLTNALRFTVSANVGVNTRPGSNQPGIYSVITSGSYTNSASQTIDEKDVNLKITSASATSVAALERAVAAEPSFAYIKSDNLNLMDIHLYEEGTDNKVSFSGTLRVQLPLPSGTDASSTFVLLQVTDSGKTKVIVPTVTSTGLLFELSEGGAFALGYTKASSSDSNKYFLSGVDLFLTMIEHDESLLKNGGEGGMFWQTVYSAIVGAEAGSTVLVDAGAYDQVPVSIINAVRESDVTLVISWAYGEDIVITPDNAPIPEDERQYYPLSYFEENGLGTPPKTDDPAEGEAWLRSLRSSAEDAALETELTGLGQVIDITAPAHDIPENGATPAYAGLLGGLEAPGAVAAEITDQLQESIEKDP